ncbi:MAG: hypothetical protein GYB65_02225 [Chloroflexi bacterium]|nr:hypothetical protein [Chloroflexota bacterium]
MRLSEDIVRRNATAQSFERGEHYYAHGAVHDCVRRGMTLEAQVEGSQFAPYRVAITLDEAGIRSASCTCPYDFGGYCKHQVAVLLFYLRQPGVFTEQPEPSDPFDALSAGQLRTLIRTLLDQKPDLNDWFQVMIPSLTTTPPADAPPMRRTQVDTTAFRRQVQHAVGQVDYRRHWDTIWAAVGALEEAHAQARSFLHGGDFTNALALMRVFGEEVIPDYGDLEEECQLADFLDVWSRDLTEAILGANLPDDERRQLSDQLTRWAGELSDYGADEILDQPIAACERGWDAPSNDLDELDYEFVVDLTDAQLNVLERQGDPDAYLALCRERGAHYRYARQLAELGRIEDAIGHVLQHSMEASNYLHLAQFLRGQGHIEAAYQVGMQGLSGWGRKYEMGQWVAELAETLGRADAAQQAWRAAFDSSPSLEAYQNLKRLAGDNWARLRPQLMEHLRQAAYRTVLIEVLIEDRSIAEAIQVWDNYPYWSYELLGRLVDAAGTDHPDWAVQQALKEAQNLIVKGSKYYPHAVRWLGKVKRIYFEHDRQGDWQQRLAAIRAEHGRKYSLMGQLRQLD